MTSETHRKGNLAIASDFDGTLLEYDISEKILMKFARKGWRRYDELLAEKKVTLEQCMRAQYGMIRARSRKELIESIDEYCVFRPGTAELIERCRDDGIRFQVVSAGIDFTIRYAFEKNGIETPELVCPRSRMKKDGSIVVTFPRFASPGANYKERLVSTLQEKGRFVVFMGNGMGDLAASSRADKVFAIRGSTLDVSCKAQGIVRVPIDDFHDVLGSKLLVDAR